MLEPLKKKKLYEEIVKQLTDLIEEGKLLPGDKLPSERQLAEELNVSRTAIREALRAMESMGYIESKVGGGTFVKAISLDNVLNPFSAVLSQNKKLISELLEVRQLLEAEITLLAAKRATDKDFEAMQKALDDMEKDIGNGGIGLEGDIDFHSALATASRNSAMSEILRMCAGLLSKSRQTTLSIPGQPTRSLNDHKAIFNSIKNGSEVLAQELMKDHIKKAIANFNANYKDD